MNHVVLLGDSVFDNENYSGPGRDVSSQLRQLLASDWKVTLLAVDGSMTQNTAAQLKNLPTGTTHVVVSVGGNDAINSMGLLDSKAESISHVFGLVESVLTRFRQNYNTMLQAVQNPGYAIALSTIYYPRLTEPDLQKAAVTALAFYNDIIISEAVQHGFPVLDLRFICNEDADYANPIEPSAAGSAKIAAAIRRLLQEHNFSKARTEMFV